MEDGNSSDTLWKDKCERYVTSTPMEGLEHMHATREGMKSSRTLQSVPTLPEFKPIYPVRRLKSLGLLTSAHGMPFAIKTKFTVAKIFWSVIFLAGLGALGYFIYLLTMDYMSSTSYFQSSVHAMKEMEFPSVTICNENIFKRSALNNATTNSRQSKYENLTVVDEYYSNVSAAVIPAEKLPIDVASGNRKLAELLNGYDIGNLDSFISKINQLEPMFTVAEGDWNSLYVGASIEAIRSSLRPSASDLLKYGHTSADAIVRCSLNGQLCDSSDFVTTPHSIHGNCFTMNGRQLASSGENMNQKGLTLVIDLESQDYVGMLSQQVAAKLYIHQKKARFHQVSPLTVGPGMTSEIPLQTVSISRLKDDCEQESGYTIDACIERCLADTIYKRCQCSHFKDGATSDCNPFNRTQLLCKEAILYLYSQDQLTCTCRQPCQEVLYTPSWVSSVTWPSSAYMGHLKRYLTNTAERATQQYIRSNMARVNIYFENSSMEKKQERQFSWVLLLIYIGGASAFFVGISCITVIEFGAMLLELFNIVCCSCRRRRKGFKNRIQMLSNFNDLDADTSASFVAGKPDENNLSFGPSFSFNQSGIERRMYLPPANESQDHTRVEPDTSRPKSAKVAPIRHVEPSRPRTAMHGPSDLHKHAWEHDGGRQQLYGRVLVSGKARNIQEAPMLNELQSQASNHSKHNLFHYHEHPTGGHHDRNHHKRHLPSVPGTNRSDERLINIPDRHEENHIINPHRRRLPLDHNYRQPEEYGRPRGISVLPSHKKRNEPMYR